MTLASSSPLPLDPASEASGHSAAKRAAFCVAAVVVATALLALDVSAQRGGALALHLGGSSTASVNVPAHAATAMAASAASRSRVVRSTYYPSALEAQWTANIVEWDADLCTLLASSEQRAAVALLLEIFDSQERFAASSPEHAELLRHAESEGILSLLLVEFADGSKRTILLEPLVGMLRDPRTGCPEGKRHMWGIEGPPLSGASQVEKKMWHLVAPPALGSGSVRRNSSGIEGARAVLFDIGASSWSGVRGNNAVEALGARWLAGAYAAIGVVFEDIYSWEASEIPPRKFFTGATLEELGKIHFMNWPVASAAEDELNPWSLLRRIASPDDFVVVKLDIDTPIVEGELLRQLMEDPGLPALVDVFYFEHHVRIHDFEWMWGADHFSSTLNASYTIFAKLRGLRICAHSWP
jgi:hypothetical protein